jgi:hemolysin activation/secretion protein
MKRTSTGCEISRALMLSAMLLPLPDAAAQLPSDVARTLRFQILEVRVEGNTLVAGAELKEAITPLLGAQRSIADLDAVRRAILEAYRARGYELLAVQYDPRRSTGGVHFFVVREVRIGGVRVSGLRELSEAGVRAQLPALKEGETPQLAQLARELFLFNDNPGRAAVLEYTQGKLGISDVEIRILERPQSGFAVSFNNTGTGATGRTRAGLTWSEYDFLKRGHQLVASLTTSPERPSSVVQGGLSYSVPLPAAGDTVSVATSYSDVDSGRVADVFNVSGKGFVWGLRYTRNFWRTAQSRHSVDVGYDQRRYRDIVDFFGVNLGTSVTEKPASLAYRYAGSSATDGVSAGVLFQQNIPGGAHNDDPAYAASRAGAVARWNSLQADIAWQRELASGWSPAMRLAGQYTGKPLVAVEQFGLGGIRAVRGFAEREGAADKGWRANLELHGPRIGEGHRMLAFVDFGETHRLKPQVGETAGEGVSSFGLGWRSSFAGGSGIAADLARVANGSLRTSRGEWMLHLAAVWRF